jgi:nitrous oxide reductase
VLRGRLRLTFALGAVALVSLLSLAACGGGDEPASKPSTTTPSSTATETETTETTETTTTVEETAPVVVRVVVVDGVPEGGIVRETVGKGDRVQLVVRSDVADEVHLHGYDLSRAVAPGQPARIAFVADVPGRFEVELEESGVQIADLTVRP